MLPSVGVILITLSHAIFFTEFVSHSLYWREGGSCHEQGLEDE